VVYFFKYVTKLRHRLHIPKTLHRIIALLNPTLVFYFTTWNKTKAILIGYSLGAEVLPLLVNHLSLEILARVDLVALLEPAQTAQFKFHLTDWGVAISG
jgi:type IV secretory pathway VirJ component